MTRAAAALALLLPTLPAPLDGDEAPERPIEARVVVSARPRVGQPPVHVHAQARIHDPKRELQCPTFTWAWGDDTESSWRPHCDPYQPIEQRSDLWVIWTNKAHVYRRPGIYDLAMVVTAGDRTLRATVRVVVAGEAGLIADGGGSR